MPVTVFFNGGTSKILGRMLEETDTAILLVCDFFEEPVWIKKKNIKRICNS